MSHFSHILVTGATGFLGGRLVERLCRLDGVEVLATGRSLGRKAEFEALGATFLPGDLADPAFVHCLLEALTEEGEAASTSAVVHCAALSSPWGRYEEFERANLHSSLHVLQASRQWGVKRLVNIGTPSIYANFTDRHLVKESDPLPRRMVNHYAATKLLAERAILEAHGDGIEAISLRPRALIGRGDTVIFPRILRAYEEGRLRIIGKGDNVSDVTCVSNAVDAILMALQADQKALGRAYNITNGEPLPLWELFGYLFQGLGLPLSPKKVPYPLVDRIAALMEWSAHTFQGGREPTLTRYSISTLAHSMSLDISQARDLLGYQPAQTSFQGIDEFIRSYLPAQ